MSMRVPDPSTRGGGNATRQSQEIYPRLALADAQQRYDDVIGDSPPLTSTITLVWAR